MSLGNSKLRRGNIQLLLLSSGYKAITELFGYFSYNIIGLKTIKIFWQEEVILLSLLHSRFSFVILQVYLNPTLVMSIFCNTLLSEFPET